MARLKVNGFHTSSTGLGVPNDIYWLLDSLDIPFTAKTADGGLFDAISVARARINNGKENIHQIVYRRSVDTDGVYNPDVPNYLATPYDAAVQHWNWHRDRFTAEVVANKDIVWVETINEPDKDTPGITEWLAEFSIHTAELAWAEGYKYLAFGWSGGTPEPEHWRMPKMQEFLQLAGTNPHRLGVALHEYSWLVDDIWNGRSGTPGNYTYTLIGRCTDLFSACDENNIARPPVIITEWGWAYDSVPDPVTAMAQIYEVGELYAQYPEILGAAIWYLGGGFGNISQSAIKLAYPLQDLLVNTIYPDPDPPPPVSDIIDGDILVDDVSIADVTEDIDTRITTLETIHDIVPPPSPTMEDVQDAKITVNGVSLTDFVTQTNSRLAYLESLHTTDPPPPLPDGHLYPLGLDVSKWQGESINWAGLVAAGVTFIYIRLGSAYSLKDDNFDWNWSNAGSHGLLRGFYWYLYPENVMAISDQVDHVVANFPNDAELPMALDVEETSGDLTAAMVQQFVNELIAKEGRNPIIYTGRWYWNPYLGDGQTWASNYDLWTANYTQPPGTIPDGSFVPLIPDDWQDWTFWQWTSSGGLLVGQTFSPLDLNYYHGTPQELQDYSQSFINGEANPAGVDVLSFMKADADAFRVVRHSSGQYEDIQDLDLGGGMWVRRKGGNAEWWREDGSYAYLIHDTSPGPDSSGRDRCYTIHKDGTAGNSPKNPVIMQLNQRWDEVGNHFVQFSYKDNCEEISDPPTGYNSNWATLVGHYFNYNINSYGQNITLDEVIVLETTNSEFQFYAKHAGKTLGWVGWQSSWGSSELIEIHYDREPLNQEPDRYCNWI